MRQKVYLHDGAVVRMRLRQMDGWMDGWIG